MKKLTALVLALLMLALPVMGMAASPDELFNQVTETRPYKIEGKLTWGNTSLLDADTQTLVKDFVDAISYTYAGQEKQTDFALQLSGTDVLTLSTATQGEDTYVLSNLLGGTITFNEAEGIVLLDYLMNLAVASEMMTAEAAAELKSTIQQALNQTEAAELNLDELDTTALVAWVTDLAARITTEEVTQQPKNSDPAAQLVSITLTGEDLTQLYTLLFDSLKNNDAFIAGLSSANLTMDGQPVTAEELVAALPEMAKMIGDAVQGDIPVNLYLDADGNPVYGTAAVTMTMESEGETATITMALDYTRLTVAAGATHAFNLIAADASNNGIALSATVLNSDKLTTVNAGIGNIEAGVTTPVLGLDVKVEKEYGDAESELDLEAVLTIVSDGQELTLGLDIDKETKLNGEDAVYECDLDISFLGEEILCIKVTSATGEAAPSIVTADAVRPGQMTEEEFNTYAGETVMPALQMALVNLVQNLPASILSLMMGE